MRAYLEPYRRPLQAVPVGCGRFISSGLTVVPSGRDRASRASLSWPWLSPMERGASTLEESKGVIPANTLPYFSKGISERYLKYIK